MNNRFTLILLIFVSFCVFSAHGQEVDTTALKQIDMAKKMLFAMGSEIHVQKKLQFKRNPDYHPPWDVHTSAHIQMLTNGLDSIVKNGSIEIKEDYFDKTVLTFKSKVADIDNIAALFKLQLLESNIADTNEQAVIFENSAETHYGSSSSAGIRNGEPYSFDYQTVKCVYEIESGTVSATAKGQVKFKASFPSAYDKILITTDAIGKEFTLGTKNYEVITIFDNKIVLKPTGENQMADFDFKFVNLDAEGNEITAIPYSELMKTNAGLQDSNLSVSTSMQSISENIYTIFHENPSITQKEFDSLLDPILLGLFAAKDRKQASDNFFGDKYIIISSAGPIERCYLYVVSKQVEREFQKSL